MNYHDPSRTRLANHRPCWLNSYIALPPLQLEPHEINPEWLTLTICDGSHGIWLSTDIKHSDLTSLLSHWTSDPEGAFMSIFGLPTWPQKIFKPSLNGITRTPTPISVSIPIEDLI